MYKCPHCQQDGVSKLRKLISSHMPATCQICHQQSYTHIIYSLYALGSWIALTWLFIGLSYLSSASIFLLGTIPAMIIVANKFLLAPPLLILEKK